GCCPLLRLLVLRVLAATRAILGKLKLVRRGPLVLVRVIVALFAITAFERHQSAISPSHVPYLINCRLPLPGIADQPAIVIPGSWSRRLRRPCARLPGWRTEAPLRRRWA